MIVLQVADNIPEVRPTAKPRQKPKRHTLTDLDIVNLFEDDDDMRPCRHCNVVFHKREVYRHMDKCDKRPKK